MENDISPDMLDQGKDFWNAYVAGQPAGTIFLGGIDLADSDFRGYDFCRVNLEGADLGGASLTGATLSGVVLNGAHLSGADFSDCDLTGAMLTGADLRGAFLNDADLRRVDFTGADLSRAHLKGTTLADAVFRDAILLDADLQYTGLEGACFDNTDLAGSDLTGASLTGACVACCDKAEKYSDDAALHECLRVFLGSAGWILDDVICGHIYLDRSRKMRYPRERDFLPGEFEFLSGHEKMLEYEFESSMTWLEPIILDRIASELRHEHPACGLSLVSVDGSRGKPQALFAFHDHDSAGEILSKIHVRHQDILRQLDRDEHYLDELVQQTYHMS